MSVLVLQLATIDRTFAKQDIVLQTQTPNMANMMAHMFLSLQSTARHFMRYCAAARPNTPPPSIPASHTHRP